MTNRFESLLDFAKNHVPFHRRRAPYNHRILENWPFMTKFDMEAYPLDKSSDLLSLPQEGGGFVTASGGTTAKAKYIYYAHAEMSALVRNMAHHFLSNGIKPGDGVVNYFRPGDMWGAFLLFDKTMSTLPVTVYPLGCTPRMDYALEIFAAFKPNVIAGIPSMILDFARYCADQPEPVRIEKVYYAGEPLASTAVNLLTSIWGCELIRSAGYASTDVGSIGWQCLHCKAGEHYAFDDAFVEIIDGEIVVTSLSRWAMPIIRYRTGDGGKWVTPSCGCGRGAPLFKLLGRFDNVILIWGFRIFYDEIVAVFEELQIPYLAIQVHVYSMAGEQFLLVKFESPHGEAQNDAKLRDKFYELGSDINAKAPKEVLDRRLAFEKVPIGALKRNERTGKVIPVIDLRY